MRTAKNSIWMEERSKSGSASSFDHDRNCLSASRKCGARKGSVTSARERSERASSSVPPHAVQFGLSLGHSFEFFTFATPSRREPTLVGSGARTASRSRSAFPGSHAPSKPEQLARKRANARPIKRTLVHRRPIKQTLVLRLLPTRHRTVVEHADLRTPDAVTPYPREILVRHRQSRDHRLRRRHPLCPPRPPRPP